MPNSSILFDLDGTISDPIEGLAESINHALKHFGHPTRQKNELATFVGPPLDLTFMALTGKDDKLYIRALVYKYREYYAEVGIYKNVVYPGISSAIQRLHDAGIPLAVCTSKPKQFAEKIIENANIGQYFRFIDGGDIGVNKTRQIEKLLKRRQIDKNAIMVGDRSVDLAAAHDNGLHSAGVLWGYGSRVELRAENPKFLFNVPQELTVSRFKKPA